LLNRVLIVVAGETAELVKDPVLADAYLGGVSEAILS
jgi:hypothetical protein